MRLPPAAHGRVPLLVCLLLLAPCCPSSKRRGQGRRCRKARTCEECTQMQAVCGWCGATQTCMAGSHAQPLQLQCPAGYRYDTCAARIVNATVLD